MSVLTPVKCSRSLNELSEKLPEILFTNSWAPSKEELAATFRQVSLYHQGGKLNADNVTLYQQQLIASLLTLDIESKKVIGNILEISNFWQSCFAMFMARVDSLTVEIIIRDIRNILVLTSSESKFKIIKDIDSLAQTAISRAGNNSSEKNIIQSVRLSNIKALIADYTESDKSTTWLKGALKAQIRSQIDAISIFNNFMRDSTNFQSELARNSNAFLMTYLKSGHIRNVWIYAKQSAFDNLAKEHKEICKQLDENQLDNMLMLVQVGNYIWLQTDRLESFGVYNLPENYSDLQVLVSNMVEKKCNFHYLFSRKGFWQYKLALSFKNGTNFIPKRSDYLNH
ncbi:hypothetical protein [Colwellia sp. C1TZA3]|uniref:hypothetical protein n=1 Tax=Colwellia sp. C1TZA3 TaxID=2508879 RepID=UPI0011B9507F|nr:hypothetical protein [Colwellia sp. C1TZA3]TWX73787.1 hypothetical protein ESZ39_02220 [Colwellia sp. C1TZA3]